jgi:ABC-2 type transport system permease protein
LVRTGRLDTILTMPVNSQFIVSMKLFGFDNLVSATVSLALVVFSLHKLAVTPNLLQCFLYGVAVLLGLAVHYAIMFSLATWSFWIVRAQGLIYGYFNLFNIGRYPDIVFRGIFKIIFTLIIPVILVANVPARILCRAFENPWPGFITLFAVTCLIFAVTELLWATGLRRYSSASS